LIVEKTASEIATEVQARSGPDLLSAIMDAVRASGNPGMKKAMTLPESGTEVAAKGSGGFGYAHFTVSNPCSLKLTAPTVI
jgi:hypothetical protein